MGYELATVLISSFCYDLHIKELPTLSHQPVSMTHCRGQRYIKKYEITKLLWEFSPFVLLSRDFVLSLHTYSIIILHMAKIIVQNTEITVLSHNDKDYISLTDMANGKQSESRAADIIKNWIRTRYTIEFLGTWEMIHNPNFKVVEFDHFRMQAGLPSFVMSVSEWIEKTNAIGIIVKKGRYGGTYAFKDIAFEFGTAISVTFKLYLIDEFQRLKEEEQKQLGWTAKRELSKINYRIHTDAIKSHLIPEEVTPTQASIIYAEEADVLNVAMFGMTAKQWREANPDLKGNIRDYATINELICLSNMENINAVLINDGVPQGERLVKLNQIAIQQMQVLEGNSNRNLLK